MSSEYTRVSNPSNFRERRSGACRCDDRLSFKLLISEQNLPSLEPSLPTKGHLYTGTPGFFINGVFLNGARPQSEFEEIIDTELALM